MPEAPRYVSTRDPDAPAVPFEAALRRGLAPDGGLYVPTHVPAAEPAWRGAASVAEVARAVLSPWLADEVGDALNLLLDDALDFPIPLVPLGGPWKGVYVLELFHGPTLSFKDVGARTMARLLGHFLHRTGEAATILVATSGDTGSAVADGFAGQQALRVVLLYPQGQVSPVQERQLVAARPGVTALAVDGTFDDCQRLVKEAFLDPALTARGLSSANSISVGRLLPQMVYYFWAARRLAVHTPAAPVVCVPSGNLGNLTAGLLAAEAGLPVAGFLAAHNANDFFPRYLAGEAATFAPSKPTLSNAMDVGAPSNFERLSYLFGPKALRRRVQGARVSDAETLAAIRRLYDEAGYLADPHTAVGLQAVRRGRAQGEAGPFVVLATAHPAKFPETVAEAVGTAPPEPLALRALRGCPEAVTPIAPTLDDLRAHVG